MLVAMLAASVLWGRAAAITYGQPDGNRNPNVVGALVGTFDGKKYLYCSCALISLTVFLTATHCEADGARGCYLYGRPCTMTRIKFNHM